MSEFLDLLPPDEARALFLNHIHLVPSPEVSDTITALGRVVYSPVLASESLPPFSRATMDGYALRGEDTFGASESLPAYLRLVGEIAMGRTPGFKISRTECALIHTGGMMPDGANAVVMLENTQKSRPDEIEILRAVAIGENIILAGEDVKPGQEVIPSGARLRAADIGGLMALGIMGVCVARQPRVGIISSGDEIVSPDKTPQLAQVRDVNTYSLSAAIESVGGKPMHYGIVPDRAELLETAARQALEECDLVLISAGSSASTRDLTAETIGRLGAPGILVHGINVRPGKPTILALCNGKPVIGLPGNPVSAMVITWLFVLPVIEVLLGLKTARPRSAITARLATNLPSQAGREDWVSVRLVKMDSPCQPEYMAEPVFGKSNLIFTLVRADGLVRIPLPANGLEAGELVHVYLI